MVCQDVIYAANTFYDANKRDLLSLLEEQRINETAVCKIIGLSIETRYANKPENILDILNQVPKITI